MWVDYVICDQLGLLTVLTCGVPQLLFFVLQACNVLYLGNFTSPVLECPTLTRDYLLAMRERSREDGGGVCDGV